MRKCQSNPRQTQASIILFFFPSPTSRKINEDHVSEGGLPSPSLKDDDWPHLCDHVGGGVSGGANQNNSRRRAVSLDAGHQKVELQPRPSSTGGVCRSRGGGVGLLEDAIEDSSDLEDCPLDASARIAHPPPAAPKPAVAVARDEVDLQWEDESPGGFPQRQRAEALTRPESPSLDFGSPEGAAKTVISDENERQAKRPTVSYFTLAPASVTGWIDAGEDPRHDGQAGKRDAAQQADAHNSGPALDRDDAVNPFALDPSGSPESPGEGRGSGKHKRRKKESKGRKNGSKERRKGSKKSKRESKEYPMELDERETETETESGPESGATSHRQQRPGSLGEGSAKGRSRAEDLTQNRPQDFPSPSTEKAAGRDVVVRSGMGCRSDGDLSMNPLAGGVPVLDPPIEVSEEEDGHPPMVHKGLKEYPASLQGGLSGPRTVEPIASLSTSMMMAARGPDWSWSGSIPGAPRGGSYGQRGAAPGAAVSDAPRTDSVDLSRDDDHHEGDGRIHPSRSYQGAHALESQRGLYVQHMIRRHTQHPPFSRATDQVPPPPPLNLELAEPEGGDSGKVVSNEAVSCDVSGGGTDQPPQVSLPPQRIVPFTRKRLAASPGKEGLPCLRQDDQINTAPASVHRAFSAADDAEGSDDFLEITGGSPDASSLRRSNNLQMSGGRAEASGHRGGDAGRERERTGHPGGVAVGGGGKRDRRSR